MKNVSEAAVGLAYSALLFNDQWLAAEVTQLEDRLDEMREQLELWVLRAGGGDRRPVAAARPAAPRCGVRGDRRRGAATRVAGRAERRDAPGARGRARRDRRRRRALPDRGRCRARRRGRSAGTRLGDDTGFHLLAIRRGGRYLYRPRGRIDARAPATKSSPPGRGKAGRSSPSSAATASSKTTTPARSSSSRSRGLRAAAAHSATMIATAITPTATAPT